MMKSKLYGLTHTELKTNKVIKDIHLELIKKLFARVIIIKILINIVSAIMFLINRDFQRKSLFIKKLFFKFIKK